MQQNEAELTRVTLTYDPTRRRSTMSTPGTPRPSPMNAVWTARPTVTLQQPALGGRRSEDAQVARNDVCLWCLVVAARRRRSPFRRKLEKPSSCVPFRRHDGHFALFYLRLRFRSSSWQQVTRPRAVLNGDGSSDDDDNDDDAAAAAFVSMAFGV